MSILRNTVLALSAIASISAATLVASAPADARVFIGSGHFRPASLRPAPHAIHFQGVFRRPGNFRPFFPGRFVGNFCHYGRCGYGRPYGYGGGYAPMPVGGQTYTPGPAPTRSCLRKDYTNDGQVTFSDTCTGESLTGPVGQQQQGQPQGS